MATWDYFLDKLQAFLRWRGRRKLEAVREIQAATGLTMARVVHLKVYENDVTHSEGTCALPQGVRDVVFRVADGRAEDLPLDTPYDASPATDAPTLLAIWSGKAADGRPYTLYDAHRTGHLISWDAKHPVTFRDLNMVGRALPEVKRILRAKGTPP